MSGLSVTGRNLAFALQARQPIAEDSVRPAFLRAAEPVKSDEVHFLFRRTQIPASFRIFHCYSLLTNLGNSSIGARKTKAITEPYIARMDEKRTIPCLIPCNQGNPETG